MKEPMAPIQIVSRSPSQVPSAPPSSEPIGMVPHTMKRMVAFIRPCMRAGVMA